MNTHVCLLINTKSIIANMKNYWLLLLIRDLNFEEHVSHLCIKASQKLDALARVSNYMNIEKCWKVM